MFAFARWVVLSEGWPRRFTALFGGAIGALAMAPIDAIPAMLVPMTLAVWLVDGSARKETGRSIFRTLRWRSCRAAASIGWWWGLGYFLAGLWWLGAAFLVEPGRDAWALPFGVVAVPALLALFPALGFGLAQLLWSPGAARVLALTAGLGMSEWLRGWVLTGFPWNAFGMTLGGNLVLGQSASIVGADGLTLLTIAICAAPATLADPSSGGSIRRFAPIVSAVLAVVALVGFGTARLSAGKVGDVPRVRLRIMQPNVPQDENFSYANKDKILSDYLALSDRATSPGTSGLADVTHLIWPESAFPFILSHDPDALNAIGAALPPGTLLVTGAARVQTDPPTPSGAPGRTHYFNAIEVIGPGGTILNSYDKVHLVPFGEYLPFDSLLRQAGLTNFVHIPGGFDPGMHRRLLDVPGLPPVAAAICYEAIFSGAILPDGRASGRERAGLILNVTNDGWFGQTAGPYQHFAQARLRAIEEGLPLVRAANTGISAIVDPYGRIRESLPLGVKNVLDGALPQRIEPTIFSRDRTIIQPILYLAVILGACIFGFLRRA
jgi:apolipoprotein N-acyltransferase